MPHLVYHAATLHHYELPIDRVGNVVGLGFVVLMPPALLYLDGLRRAAAGRQTGASSTGNRDARGGACGGLC